MLILENVKKVYVTGDTSVTALQGISLKFRDSEFVSILGPSGCGKTTLLNLIGGLDHYTSGNLIINGKSTQDFKDSDWDNYRNHRIGFVFQSYNLIPHQTVLSNVELALTLSGISKQERRQRAIEVLERVGLKDQIHKKPAQMSGGQMQRVAIARALVNNPDILLADEPTGALDSQTSVQIMELLKEISKDKLIIMVTHNPELAEAYSTRIVRLKDGLLTGDSDPFDGVIPVVKKDGKAKSGTDKKAKNQKESKKGKKEKKEKKPSMSLWTALSLSFNNLLTKKGRTILTSFAGSIGIIGIALILALSNGIELYIDSVQKDTLASYPIVIEGETADMGALMTSMMGVTPEGTEEHGTDAVYANPIMFRMMKSLLTTETKKNNLGKFKTYIEEHYDGIKDSITSLQYGYNIDLNVYAKDSKGNYSKSDFMDLMNSMMGNSGFSSSYTSFLSSSSSSGNSVFEELMTEPDSDEICSLITDEYDLIYGSWPKEMNEIVLVLNSRNEISDITLFSLGLTDRDDLINSMMQALSGKAEEMNDVTGQKWTYEEICEIPLKFVLPTAYYQYDETSGLWVDVSGNDGLLNSVISSGLDLKICGIIRPNEDATSTALNGSLCYTKKLTQYYLDGVMNSGVVKAQLDPANENVNVLTGLPFVVTEENDPTDGEKAASFLDYAKSLSDADKAALYLKIVTTPSDEYVETMISGFLKEYEDFTAEEIVKTIADNFAEQLGYSKEMVVSMLSEYSKDDLLMLLRTTMSEMIVENYAETAKKSITEIENTPSEEELAGIKAQITSAVFASITDPSVPAIRRLGEIGYITTVWSQSTEMDQTAIASYLQGLPDGELDALFDSVVDKQARETYAQYSSMVTADVKAKKVAAAFDQYLTTLTEADLVNLYENHMPDTVSDVSFEDQLERFGYCNPDSPDRISIYPIDFENKDVIADFISSYNKGVEKDDEITYTDIVALIMHSVTTIIDAISIVLIGFVSISLVVSSIMIGIITYISVLERTKEIGILRAIGASKRDISRVFNAETLIVGFGAGVIGIGLTLLLCIPINIIVRKLTDIQSLGAVLPPYGYLLIVLSMLLTFIAGLLPSSLAAKKDPVIALRTE